MKFQKKTVYIYEINGKEKIKITNAVDAKKWDEIFAVAEKLDAVLQKNDLGFKLDDNERSELCLYLAKNKDEISAALKDSPGKAEVMDRIEVPEPAIPSSKDGFSL
ncbi:YebG family protein [Motiliproteus sp. MSK22-1]|uniref:YebG family protein n=1 Tax=Motiliproteus sp. MSK22-1 TaxID=1897630 RepID=UPI00097726CB|nr:YebG family protein [Motiliproteus sp. MSK22-1]OMH27968.1 hypothetical protein BGP75_21560 [Motiliproteus sp. MSK22-1]